MRRTLKVAIILCAFGVALIGGTARAAGTNLVARVVGGGIQVDGIGFYPGELVQLSGIRYDGTTFAFGPATANNAGAITGIVPYSDTALSQIDARAYTSGNHAVSNITGAVPYPVVPPGYPYVSPTYPGYIVDYPNGQPIPGGYASTGYPYTGGPYGGPYPGPGFNYPNPPSGAILYPYLQNPYGNPTASVYP